MLTPANPLYSWGGLNQALFQWLNGVRAPAVDAAAAALTHIGSPDTFPIYLLAAWLLSAWRPHWLPRKNVAAFGAGFGLGAWAVGLLKASLNFPRPLAVLGPALVRVIGAPEYRYSFPSGHSAFAFLLAASLAPGTRAPVRTVLWCFACGVALSRVIVGAHFPADIVGGALLGVLAALVGRYLLSFGRDRRP
ncbi:MAG: phosphatase PAP2 family protein [Betaproteobacteria bacterium]|nr:phosphatase PAP2 family protein [Betaproteobacteria bacterium]